MREGAGRRKALARALILFAATVISFVDALLVYDWKESSFYIPPGVGSLLMVFYFVGVVGIVCAVVVAQDLRKERFLLGYAIFATMTMFAIPVYAQA